jgi:NADH-quinone oxidoreductase subunit E
MTTTVSLEYPTEDAEKLREGVLRHVEKWKDREGNLIMILHAIQNENGYVPREVAMELARAMDTSLARIYEVITFYHYFRLVPPGKHNVAVCTGTACYLKGSAGLLEEVEQLLGIKEGETTEDREFHLETVRCIGCCGMAPTMVVDEKTHGRVRTSDVTDIIPYKKGRTK